ncbi:MAG: Cof-type HAD-IIB family hydrolase [Bacteroidota bacterium]
MKYKAIISDIDGTLLNKDRELSARTLQAIRGLGPEVPVVLASSRMPKAMRHLQAELGILHCPLICYNGGYVIRPTESDGPDEVLHSAEIPLEACTAATVAAATTDVHVSLYHEDDWYVPQIDYWSNREQNNTKVVPELTDYAALLERWAGAGIGPHKIMCMGPENEVQMIEDHLKAHFSEHLSLYRSKPTYLEIAHASISKATALQVLLDRVYDFHMADFIGFGDNYNDMEMLEAVGLGVAVGNAKPEVLAIANEVTKTGKEDGVAQMIEQWMYPQ